MPSSTFQFTAFQSAGGDLGDVAWSNPGNAASSNDAHASAQLGGVAPTTSQYLVCTGANLSSLPTGILFTKIQVNIEAKGSNGEIFEIFGCQADAGGGFSVAGRNQLQTADIDLTSTDTVYTKGKNNWNFWWRDRLVNGEYGVAIRARHATGPGTLVEIDHVELVVHYETFVNPFFRHDTRPVMEIKVAGVNDRIDVTNEGGEFYQPSFSPPPDRKDWHDDAVSFLQDTLTERLRAGARRLCLRLPAGRIADQVKMASAQWEPMSDDQRDALISEIGAWHRADPEREVSLYLGSWMNEDPGKVTMANVNGDVIIETDVTDPVHVARLQRTYFPYRDFLGVRRFFQDNSGRQSEANSLALFQWARDNGMEFVYEAIPGLQETGQPDADRVGPYNAYANADDFIHQHDPAFKARFERGECTSLLRPGDHMEWGAAAWRRYMKRFSRGGYALQVHDGQLEGVDPVVYTSELDGYAMEVGPQFEQRRAHHPVATTVSTPAARSFRHSFNDTFGFGRGGPYRGVAGAAFVPVAHSPGFPVTGV